ncbi:glycoside hydrolase family 3 C-terminal domain-containing protein [Kineosporia sp. J2-2]|uniref:Glycoside hydrolase family 3 C-terminal domain-containing protein n=1 Tax=Kineosporia corallincola TaxID=2835133 RepID=A0ABS5TKM7_9ACTN|nr:glycoside hydrolase family 3 C-terminal domain-containing protein [Kineosporia corallincola]MBT0770139.1 glycoside hydrolase family 3 C-terminal domain-containing protein [Kineosporia corallincola]
MSKNASSSDLFDVEDVLRRLTDDEKVDLLSGYGMWKTAGVERLGVPATVMTDGTYGVRYSVPQIDGDEKGGFDLDDFLSVVNRRANGVSTAWGETKPATCFPTGAAMACSWDPALARRLGEALAAECGELGVDMLLGPGINLRRTPLGGRSYEYYSEDPVVTAEIAAAVVEGLQENGVGASLKHFAANNCEVERTTMDSVVEERALREGYLRAFEKVVRRSDPWTIMSSYNRLNGVQASQDPWLLTEVLRDDWGYRGTVVSDWHGIKDRPASLEAGNDLDMPESPSRKAALRRAIAEGRLTAEVLDTACRRVLEFVHRAVAARATRPTSFDRAAHHRLAQEMAARSMVLLKNDGGVLPLDPAAPRRILVAGEGAGDDPIIQGSGCATTAPTQVDVPIVELRAAFGQDTEIVQVQGTSTDPVLRERLLAEAVEAARGTDVAIVFVHTDVAYDGEGTDRTTLDLSDGHDELVSALAAVCPQVVVLVASPDAVVMPWLDEVSAVVATFLAGQGAGRAVADLLTGAAEPSGRLTTTFPARIEDIPGWLTYPGEHGRHVYSEGIHIGYRSYDALARNPLFCFGFGLGYTTFELGPVSSSSTVVGPDDVIELVVPVTNTGARRGRETVQIYAEHLDPRVRRAPRELVAFAGIELEPGQTGEVRIPVPAEDLRFWDTSRQAWVLDDEEVRLHAARSSRDLVSSVTVTTTSTVSRHRPVRRDTQPVFILDNPPARRATAGFLARTLGHSPEEMDRMLDYSRDSFFGIVATLERRFRISFTDAQVEELLAAIRAETGE